MIPNIWKLTLPILKLCENGNEIHTGELSHILANQLKLTWKEINQRTPAGKQFLFKNRVGWAVFVLRKANFLTKERGIVSITKDGKKTLEKQPKELDRNFFHANPTYKEYYDNMKKKNI